MNRVNEPCLEQFLNLSLNGYCFPRIDWMKFLSNRLSIRIRCDFMFNYFRIDAWHFLIRLGKNIAELFEKVRVNLNLFRGEICSDEDILHDARVSGDVDRYSFSDSRHISLSINFLCS
jgi:hypothetical protein